MDAKIQKKILQFDKFSLHLKFSSGLIIFVVILYVLTRERKRTPSANGGAILFPFSKYIFCAVKHTLGMAVLPITEIFMRFGNMFYLNCYTTVPWIVVSNDYETIKHIMDQWIDRPKHLILALRNNGVQDRGILLSSGDVWIKTRKYTAKSISQLGLGKRNNLEYTTHEELKNILQNLEKLITKTDNNVPIRNLFSLTTINVIWEIIEGTKFSEDADDVRKIVKAADRIVETNFYQFMLVDILRHFAVKAIPLFSFHNFLKSTAVVKRYFTDVINRHLLTIQKNGFNDSKESFTDNFIRQMTSKTTENRKIGHIFNRDNLMVTLFDLFEAGVDTTSSTLEFAIMYLATHPDVQQKMQNEIKTVIGDDEPSYYSNKANLPYTLAVIQEVHRMSSIVPLNFRSAISDCYINDTFIKKGTGALINLYSVHYNAKFWGDPYNFRPERFFGNDGCLDPSKLRRVLSFGGGKRLCLGENVANSTIFTFLIGILQRYTVHLADPNEDLGLDPSSSFTSRAKPFDAKFVPMQH